MRRFVLLVGILALLVPADRAGATHYCDGGTLITVPLPPNPVDPARTHLYIHDRGATPGTGLMGNPLDPSDETEGLWVYLESGKRPNEYNPYGGPAIIGPLNATPSDGDPCARAGCDPGPLASCPPRAGSDDLII